MSLTFKFFICPALQIYLSNLLVFVVQWFPTVISKLTKKITRVGGFVVIQWYVLTLLPILYYLVLVYFFLTNCYLSPLFPPPLLSTLYSNNNNTVICLSYIYWRVKWLLLVLLFSFLLRLLQLLLKAYRRHLAAAVEVSVISTPSLQHTHIHTYINVHCTNFTPLSEDFMYFEMSSVVPWSVECAFVCVSLVASQSWKQLIFCQVQQFPKRKKKVNTNILSLP